MAERPGPEANIKPGPSHKLHGNYYYTRDGRREVAPPTVLADGGQKELTSGGAEGATSVLVAPKTPGTSGSYSSSF